MSDRPLLDPRACVCAQAAEVLAMVAQRLAIAPHRERLELQEDLEGVYADVFELEMGVQA